MNERLTLSRWPPRCCVPAFVTAALEILGEPSPDRAALARTLAVRVLRGDQNPFALEEVTDTQRVGLSASRAESLIPQFFAKEYSALAFRHIRFAEVPFRMHWELAGEFLDAGCIVGVGFAYGYLIGRTSSSHLEGNCDRHVVRIEEIIGHEVAKVIDDSGEMTSPYLADLQRLESAAQLIKGGFWVIGAEAGVRSASELIL